MAPKSNVPIRIGGSKVRSGCKTCKRRHLKCDEQRPICLRCAKLTLSCVYEPISPRQSPTPGNSLNCYGTRPVEEINALKSFIVDLGPELAGCFSNELFCNVLPRVAQRESVIFDAILAVSMLNNSVRLSQSAEPAIRQYDRAIQALNIRLAVTGESQRQRQDVILLCCLLFTFFECLQNSFVHAMHHIVGGMKLLMEWGPSETPDDVNGYVSRATLQPIYLALDSQAVQLGAIGFREFSGLPAIDQSQRCQWPPFETFEQAHCMLSLIFNRVSRWAFWMEPVTAIGTRPGEDWMSSEKHQLQRQLMAWDVAFNTLIYSDNPALLLLLVHRKVLQVFYERASDGWNEMAWDKYTSQFEEAVQYAETYFRVVLQPAAENRGHAGTQNRAVFTVALDVVLPLFLCSARCRNPSIRRRALRMLKVCRRKEGVWDSSACASICEKVIELEEREALPDGTIPEYARIYEMDLRLREETGASIAYKRRLRNGDIEEILADVEVVV